jgi:hypothetical protein
MFTVNSATAGTHNVSLSYSKDTGSSKTLSLYVYSGILKKDIECYNE